MLADDDDPDRLRPTTITRRVVANKRVQYYVMRFANVAEHEVLVPADILKGALNGGRLLKLMQDYAGKNELSARKERDKSGDEFSGPSKRRERSGPNAAETTPTAKRAKIKVESPGTGRARKMATLEATLDKLKCLRKGIAGRP